MGRLRKICIQLSTTLLAALAVTSANAQVIQKVLATVPVGSIPGNMGVNTTTSKVYVCNTNNSMVTVIDGVSGAVTATVPTGAEPVMAAVIRPAIKFMCPMRRATISR